jgi:hypothetical protein
MAKQRGDGELRHGIEDRFRDRVFSAARFAERELWNISCRVFALTLP